jgi:hypothetical protein
MLKGKQKPADNAGAVNEQPPQFKENPEINAKIDDYIQANPKHWQYIQAMPPDRMARALVLNEVQKNERMQKMDTAILRKLDQNPEMKQSIANLVKTMPEEQRERATISLARKAMQTTAPRQSAAGAKV